MMFWLSNRLSENFLLRAVVRFPTRWTLSDKTSMFWKLTLKRPSKNCMFFGLNAKRCMGSCSPRSMATTCGPYASMLVLQKSLDWLLAVVFFDDGEGFGWLILSTGGKENLDQQPSNMPHISPLLPKPYNTFDKPGNPTPYQL